MFGEKERNIFEKLELEYPAIAIKFCCNKPLGFEQVDGKYALCTFLEKAQKENKAFYISVENEDCMGKMVLGMESLESPHCSMHMSGTMGPVFGAFRTPAPNARLYYDAPMLKRAAVNFVVFCPVSQCEFHPDLIICVADTKKASILLRASSYISGDIWESKSSFVLSCAWTYIHPYVSGKINHIVTGMHLGLSAKGSYPPGLHVISIPYQKLGELTEALEEMPWELDFMKHDEKADERDAQKNVFVEEAGADINYPLALQ